MHFIKTLANMHKRKNSSSTNETPVAYQPETSKSTNDTNKPLKHTLEKLQRRERIPQTKEDWMKFMITRIKHKLKLSHTTDKEIEMTIKRARPILFTLKAETIDPDMPDCYYWTEQQVSSWIGNLGYPEVKEMFSLNNINGRRLVNIDASVLNQMGLRDLTRMMKVTKSIREILEIPPPNALRAIMRLVPWEMYLQRKSRTGTSTDSLTFKTFCEISGFPYDLVKKNKCLKVPPTCTVQIKPSCQAFDDDDVDTKSCISIDSPNSSGSSISLDNCPTVEFLVRNQPTRDHLIQDVLHQVIQTVLEEVSILQAKLEAQQHPPHTSNPIEDRAREIFNKAYLKLDIEDPAFFQQRVEFVVSMTEELMNDVLKTRTILKDMEQFQKYMETSMNPETIRRARELAEEVLEEVSPIAALLALGQLELGALIREAPGLQAFISGLITTAENEAIDLAREISTNARNASTPIKNLLSQTKLRLALTVKRNSLSPVKVL